MVVTIAFMGLLLFLLKDKLMAFYAKLRGKNYESLPQKDYEQFK